MARSLNLAAEGSCNCVSLWSYIQADSGCCGCWEGRFDEASTCQGCGFLHSLHDLCPSSVK
ncbi:hypothetical protein BCR44DRAFT_1427104 [Catenaria anguillulae PL171]|uniref:Uncharacterized protein n=1 Tax=Catenaria anguillulae PL171 TaxID=765915 RepID=A0A1Y2HWQ8_9FUNG|nr:hypothetical protein BCR44DRAFT_1427104 [Catenaria anguillulae PL171]